MSNNTKQGTFHLGITMAGAVSAGAYTAGFMDYVPEALSAWEEAKKEHENNPNSNIPDHTVIIDAIGGASAGGMVSMITTLALCAGGIKPVREVSRIPKPEIFFMTAGYSLMMTIAYTMVAAQGKQPLRRC